MSAEKLCSLCGDHGVAYHRRYSGENLCRPCFSRSIVEKVERTISKQRMLHYGETIAVAVSGGKDSLSLLHILSQLCGRHSSKLLAITVDEGVRDYREESLEYAREFAKYLGIAHAVVSFKEVFGHNLDESLRWKGERNVSSCSICGILRRRAIDEAAAKVGADVVATAHNLDDVLQTFFINLFNADLARIRMLRSGMENHAGSDVGVRVPRRIKPLGEVYEAEVAMYAFLNGIPFQSVPCPYMNEGIRTEIRQMLNSLEEKHPGIKYSALRSALTIADELPESFRKRLDACIRCGGPTSNGVCSVCQTLQLIHTNKA